MRTVSVSALVALSLAVQQAAATGWLDYDTFKNPYNTNNKCTDKMSAGLAFDDHPDGDLGNYGDMNWGNAQCGNGLTKRTFGDSHSKGSKSAGFAGGKCARGTASKDKESSPKFSCGAEQEGMSIRTVHVSSEEDTELELEYGYDNDQPPCKQTYPCKAGGSVLTNSQCGDAKSVTVKLPKDDTKEKCEVGIHSVDFHCGPSSKPPVPSSTPIPSSPVESTPVSSKPVETKPYPIPTFNATTSAGPTAPISTPVESTPVESPVESTPVESTPAESTPVETTPIETTPVESTPVESTPVESTPIETHPVDTTASVPETTVPVVTTQVIYTTLTTCPVTNTVTSGDVTSVETTSSISTVLVTSTSTICTQCVPPPVATPETSTIPEIPVITSPVPEVPDTTNPVPEVPETTNPVPEVPETTSPVPEVPVTTTPLPSSVDESPEETTSSSVPVPTTTQAVVTTAIIYTTVTTCPVTNTIISGSSTSFETLTTVSTVIETSTSTVCTQCIPPAPEITLVPPPASGTPAPSVPIETPSSSGTADSPVASSSPPAVAPSSQPPAPPAPCPTVLPACMKTWIQLTTCKDNSDSDCYCQNTEFTEAVQQCVSSWASSNIDVQGALSYLAGICAPHVSQNPGIITNVPKTITLVPTPATVSSPPPADTASPPPAGSPPAVSPPAVPAASPPAASLPAASPPAASPPVDSPPVDLPPVDSPPASPESSPVGVVTVSGEVPPGITTAPVIRSPSNFDNSPIGSTSPPAEAAPPVTTISVSLNVPCPVSQIPDGQVQAPVSTSCSSVLITQVTVPAAGFQTVDAAPGATGGSNVVLTAGAPAVVPATPTLPAGGVANSPIGGATTLGTVVGSTNPGSTAGIVPFTAGASNVRITSFGAVLAGVIGLLVLV
ncbi:MAG: hypothetical protein Q9174_001690 [Haloplaca sp. 1 TL-2023]